MYIFRITFQLHLPSFKIPLIIFRTIAHLQFQLNNRKEAFS